MKKAFYLFALVLFLAPAAWSQLHIEPMHPPEMMSDFFNTDCASVSNLTFDGSSIAYFEGAHTDLGLLAGMFLSTGDVFSAIGENSSESTSGTTSGASDVDLEAIATAQIMETSIIEMDLVSDTDLLSFAYVFASEEYCEYVNSSFNDVFGFFISGPGLNGPYTNGAINAAMLPDGMPVAINSVNHLLNQEYFVGGNASCGTGPIPFISFDGMTTVMSAEVPLIPGETYHVKIAVGDVSDGIFDSGVLIGIQSLCGDSLLVPPSEFVVTQGNDGEIFIENESKYATSYLWDFGDGNTSTEKNPENHVYDFSVQSEYQLSLITQNYCCSDTFSLMVTADVSEPVAAFTSNTQIACPNTEIQYLDNSTGPVDSWEWTFPGGYPETSTEENPLVSYAVPGTYSVTLIASNSLGSNTIESPDFVTILAGPEANLTFADLGNYTFSFTNLSQNADNWLWNFGDGNSSDEENSTHIYDAPGIYTVSLEVGNVCGTSLAFQEIEIIVDGVTETPEQLAIQFHPNPAETIVQLNGLTQAASLVAYNHIGQVVLKKLVKPNETIQVKDWPRGLYLLNITLDDATEPLVRKLILE